MPYTQFGRDYFADARSGEAFKPVEQEPCCLFPQGKVILRNRCQGDFKIGCEINIVKSGD
jgi:hypothetical protein